MIISIDGKAQSGKTTFSSALAKHCLYAGYNAFSLSSGLLYRFITKNYLLKDPNIKINASTVYKKLHQISNNHDIFSEELTLTTHQINVLNDLVLEDFHLGLDKNKNTNLFYQNQHINADDYSDESLSILTSYFATIPQIRILVNNILYTLCLKYPSHLLFLDGRDLNSYVFKDMDARSYFIDVDNKQSAYRKYSKFLSNKEDKQAYEKAKKQSKILANNIYLRNYLDSHRRICPMEVKPNSLKTNYFFPKEVLAYELPKFHQFLAQIKLIKNDADYRYNLDQLTKARLDINFCCENLSVQKNQQLFKLLKQYHTKYANSMLDTNICQDQININVYTVLIQKYALSLDLLQENTLAQVQLQRQLKGFSRKKN